MCQNGLPEISVFCFLLPVAVPGTRFKEFDKEQHIPEPLRR